MKATNIEWDVSGDDIDENTSEIPTEIDIPKEIENDEEAISDYLTDETGFCHCGYVLER